MATLTEFTNLAEVSDRQSSTDSANSNEDFLENSGYGKRYRKVSKSDVISYANGRPAASKIIKTTSDVQGSTISFHNLKYTVETKSKKKKVSKEIIKEIRYFFKFFMDEICMLS